jgi:DNA polymerase-3 subunit delta'
MQLPVSAQPHVFEFLRRAHASGRGAHAYLFHGPEGAGKEAVALQWAQTLLCERKSEWACEACKSCRRIRLFDHPDVHFIFPRNASASEEERREVLNSIAQNPFFRNRPWENPQILIGDIRDIKQKLSMTSYEGRGTAIIIAEAEKMRDEPANALLKILEEPPEKTYFILTTPAMEMVMPTIVSRCHPLRFANVGTAEIKNILTAQAGVEPARAEFVAALADGSLRRAFAMLETAMDDMRRQAVDLLRTAFKAGRPADQAEFVETLVKEKDRTELRQILEFCLLWIRDGMILHASREQPEAAPATEGPLRTIVNADMRDSLMALVTNLPDLDYAGVIGELEFAIHCLDRYVQPWLVLMVMLQKIRALARLRRQT